VIFRRRRRPAPPTTPGPAPALPTTWLAWGTVPDDRRGLAAEIDTCADFGVDEQGPATYQVALFDDLRGLVGDDAIEALAPKIAALEGVERCEHSDRELIDVEGPITAEQLRAFVIAELAVSGDPHFWDDRDG
jgi:hypothetical protein